MMRPPKITTENVFQENRVNRPPPPRSLQLLPWFHSSLPAHHTRAFQASTPTSIHASLQTTFTQTLKHALTLRPTASSPHPLPPPATSMPPPDIPLPTRLLLAHAGSPEVNGEYHWAGSVNGRPFWQRSDSETCVWYFKSPSVLTMTFDGWSVRARPSRTENL